MKTALIYAITFGIINAIFGVKLGLIPSLIVCWIIRSIIKKHEDDKKYAKVANANKSIECSNCHTKNKDTNEFCSNCGSKLVNSVLETKDISKKESKENNIEKTFEEKKETIQKEQNSNTKEEKNIDKKEETTTEAKHIDELHIDEIELLKNTKISKKAAETEKEKEEVNIEANISYCRKCGAKLDDNLEIKFCKKCGAKVRD